MRVHGPWMRNRAAFAVACCLLVIVTSKWFMVDQSPSELQFNARAFGNVAVDPLDEVASRLVARSRLGIAFAQARMPPGAVPARSGYQATDEWDHIDTDPEVAAQIAHSGIISDQLDIMRRLAGREAAPAPEPSGIVKVKFNRSIRPVNPEGAVKVASSGNANSSPASGTMPDPSSTAPHADLDTTKAERIARVGIEDEGAAESRKMDSQPPQNTVTEDEIASFQAYAAPLFKAIRSQQGAIDRLMRATHISPIVTRQPFTRGRRSLPFLQPAAAVRSKQVYDPLVPVVAPKSPALEPVWGFKLPGAVTVDHYHVVLPGGSYEWHTRDADHADAAVAQSAPAAVPMDGEAKDETIPPSTSSPPADDDILNNAADLSYGLDPAIVRPAIILTASYKAFYHVQPFSPGRLAG